MSSLITKNFKITLAKQVYNLLEIGANSYLPAERKSYVYAVIGKQLPWNTGTEVAPAPTETVSASNEYFKRAIYAKQLSIENASLVVPRINWTSNTVYNTYVSNTNFYVLNSKDQVFKCLYNNNAIASTDEPELTLSTTSLEEPFVQTADGYKWKYMMTLSTLQKQKFLTSEWMPVTVNKFVRAAAEPGSIDIVTVTNSGNNYTNGSTQDIIRIDGDGTGAILKANVSNNKVQNIIIQNRGTNYTYANLSFSDVVGGIGSGAAATVAIAPVDGHGYDPVYELGASTVLFTVEFAQNESSSLPTNNDFREIFLVQNPQIYGSTTLASSSAYTLYTRVKVSPGVGDYNVDEAVYQGDSYATATFTADVISFDSVQNLLYLNNVKGTLETNKTIWGVSSGSIRVVNSFLNPTLKPYSGKILYISDKLPITRDASQTERIRFVLSF
jgi:hypothetical protein